MSKYILNKNKQDSPSGENYEVHNEDKCNHLPLQENRLYLGHFDDCKSAMIRAKSDYPSWARDIDGCCWCASTCHRE